MEVKEITLVFGPEKFRWFRIKIPKGHYDDNGILRYNHVFPLGEPYFRNFTEEVKYTAWLYISDNLISIKLYWIEEDIESVKNYVGEILVKEKFCCKTFMSYDCHESVQENLDKETIDKIKSLRYFP